MAAEALVGLGVEGGVRNAGACGVAGMREGRGVKLVLLSILLTALVRREGEGVRGGVLSSRKPKGCTSSVSGNPSCSGLSYSITDMEGSCSFSRSSEM